MCAIIFDDIKVDWSTKIHDGIRYLTLFGSKKYKAIYDKIRFLIS